MTSLLLPLALSLGACNDVIEPTQASSDAATGSVAFRLSPSQLDSLSAYADEIEIQLGNGTTNLSTVADLSSPAEFPSIPVGSWRVSVALRRGGVVRYEGTAFVTVTAGATVQARVVLSPARGNLVVEIGVQESPEALPTELVGSWILESMPALGKDTVEAHPGFMLGSDGISRVECGCDGITLGTWNADDSLLWVDRGTALEDLLACKIGGEVGVVLSAFTGLMARPLVWSIATGTGRLELLDPASRKVLAIFRKQILTTGGIPSRPGALVGTWYLWEAGERGGVTVKDTVPLQFGDDGTLSAFDGCNTIRGSWSVRDDSTVGLEMESITKRLCPETDGDAIGPAVHGLLRRPVRWTIGSLFGAVGDNRELLLADSASGKVLGTWRNAPPKAVYMPFLPIVTPDPMSVTGVWGLVSMPIEGLDSVKGSTLVFDSTGRFSGYIACNTVSGSWSIDTAGKLRILGYASTFVGCTDSVYMLVERGMNLLASVPLEWKVDTSVLAGVADTIRLSSSITGAPMAVFLRSRFGVAYTASDSEPFTVPRMDPVPFIARGAGSRTE